VQPIIRLIVGGVNQKKMLGQNLKTGLLHLFVVLGFEVSAIAFVFEEKGSDRIDSHLRFPRLKDHNAPNYQTTYSAN
jgi:hypothetical protein